MPLFYFLDLVARFLGDGLAFLAAAFLGAAFLGAAFLGAAFLTGLFFTGELEC